MERFGYKAYTTTTAMHQPSSHYLLLLIHLQLTKLIRWALSHSVCLFVCIVLFACLFARLIITFSLFFQILISMYFNIEFYGRIIRNSIEQLFPLISYVFFFFIFFWVNIFEFNILLYEQLIAIAGECVYFFSLGWDFSSVLFSILIRLYFSDFFFWFCFVFCDNNERFLYSRIQSNWCLLFLPVALLFEEWMGRMLKLIRMV